MIRRMGMLMMKGEEIARARRVGPLVLERSERREIGSGS